jgi:hypothetical protein
MIRTVHGDEDFDGREDIWEVYEKGARRSYTADNDRNGVVDEWGRFEQGRIVERNWSFSNDKIADKRALARRRTLPLTIVRCSAPFATEPSVMGQLNQLDLLDPRRE